MLIRTPKAWEIPEREATPEHVYLNRRALLKAAGFAAAGVAGAFPLLGSTVGIPAKRNEEFKLDREITPEWAATGYNNYYEFSLEKTEVKDLVEKFVINPWKFEVTGLVNKPQTFDLDSLLKSVQQEERLYRLRCVEAWSMAVPWTGFTMKQLIEKVDPKPDAKFIRFTSVNRPDEMPGIRAARGYPWPYQEGLRMDEAMNPLAMFVTGVYGNELPKQNGSPFRIIMPWKYGLKSGKSIVKIEFVATQPKTLWNEMASNEYGFYSNVNPRRPHPRWSQASEKVLPNMDRRPTLLYNGYQEHVASMYNGEEF
jgi:sulfoxide reductase catalytic subunit YedY